MSWQEGDPIDGRSIAEAPAAQAAAAAGPDQAALVKMEMLRRGVRGCGSWFYWIAGLSLVNTAALITHARFHFPTGLGVTRIVDEIMAEFGSMAMTVGLPINLLFAGIYAAFGYYAVRRTRWAFIAGMVLYTLDSLILVIAQYWIGVGFHALALYFIWGGLKADGKLREMEALLVPTPREQ